MIDDLVKFARSHQDPPFILVDGALKKTSHVLADALEAQAAEITRLRAELATARRDGRKEMAEEMAGWHDAIAKEWSDKEHKFTRLRRINTFTNIEPDQNLDHARRCAEAAIAHKQRAAAIRAAAEEGK